MTIPRLAFLLTIALFITGCAAPGPKEIDQALVGEILTNSELAENLRELSVPGGRVSGTENAEKAEQYVANQCVEYGLSNVHFESFPMTSWLDNSTKVTILDDPPRVLEIAQSLGNCLSTPPEGVTAEVIFVGDGTPEEFEIIGNAMKGKLVLANRGKSHRAKKMKMALERGAVGLIHVSNHEDRVVVGQCHREPNAAPGIAITKADGDALVKRLEAGETIRMNIQIDARSWDAEPRNVIAEVPGEGPYKDEVILIGAHLDGWHLAEAALDNGAGCVAILEAARALAVVKPAPKRTIRFVWFMGEEHGLWGCTAYVEQHEQDLDQIRVMANFDMPGEPRGIYHFGHPEIEPILMEVVEALPGYVMKKKIDSNQGYWSDHAPFMRDGICCVSMYGAQGDGVKFYHTPGDTYESVDLHATNGAAVGIAVLARHLADADPLPAKRLSPEECEKRGEENNWPKKKPRKS